MINEEERIPLILFLGAGASAEAGVPPTRKFAERFNERLEKEHDGQLPAELDLFLSAMERHQSDIEDLLEVLQSMLSLTPYHWLKLLGLSLESTKPPRRVWERLARFHPSHLLRLAGQCY